MPPLNQFLMAPRVKDYPRFSEAYEQIEQSVEQSETLIGRT
jgi:hypothetical protein